MKFLAMSKRMPGVADAEVTKHGEAEALAVFRLMQAGIFDQIHYSADWKGAVLLVHAGSRQEAQKVLDTLPMARAGCIAFDLYELTPFDHYARLFKDEFRAAL